MTEPIAMEPEPDEADRRRSPHPDPWPTLTPEWEMVLLLSDGVEHPVPVADQAEAEAKGRGLVAGTWVVRKRMVGPWDQVGPVRRNRIASDEVEWPPPVRRDRKAP